MYILLAFNHSHIVQHAFEVYIHLLCVFLVTCLFITCIMSEFVRDEPYLMHSSVYQKFIISLIVYEYSFVCAHTSVFMSHCIVCTCPSECILSCVRVIE